MTEKEDRSPVRHDVNIWEHIFMHKTIDLVIYVFIFACAGALNPTVFGRTIVDGPITVGNVLGIFLAVEVMKLFLNLAVVGLRNMIEIIVCSSMHPILKAGQFILVSLALYYGIFAKNYNAIFVSTIIYSIMHFTVSVILRRRREIPIKMDGD